MIITGYVLPYQTIYQYWTKNNW